MYHNERITITFSASAPDTLTAMAPRASRADRDSGGSQTLERGIRLLELLAARPDGLTVTAISVEMDTHRAGIYRLLKPLEAAQLVERKPSGAYTLGVGVISLAAGLRSGLQEIAGRELQQLADTLSCTCALTMRHGQEAVVVLVCEPMVSRMHIAYQRGLRHPLTQAASGLAILSCDPPQAGERPELRRARRAGYAMTHDELFSGASGVAVPLTAPDGTAFASISAVWLGDSVEQAKAVGGLQQCVQAITAALADERG